MQQHSVINGDKFGVCASVCQAENLVTLLESAVASWPETLDGTTEFHAERLGRLWWEGIASEALNLVHPVDAKGLDLDENLALARDWLGCVRVD